MQSSFFSLVLSSKVLGAGTELWGEIDASNLESKLQWDEELLICWPLGTDTNNGTLFFVWGWLDEVGVVDIGCDFMTSFDSVLLGVLAYWANDVILPAEPLVEACFSEEGVFEAELFILQIKPEKLLMC